MAAIEDLTVKIDFDVNGSGELDDAASAIKDVQDAADAASGPIDDVSGNIHDAGGEAGASAVSLEDLGKAFDQLSDIAGDFLDIIMQCITASTEFEESLAKLSTIADTSEVSMGELSASLIQLSNETGVAATQLADATYQAISASVDTADAVDFVETANELASGGFTDVTTAVDVLTTAINSYGLAASDAAQLSDYLITTQNLGKTTVDELASSMGQVIPLASAYGVQMDNLSSAYAVLTANGIETSIATTYIKNILSELADSGSTVAEVLEEQTGESFSELSADGYSLGDVMQVLADSVDGDTTAFSNLWSSSRAGTGALSLLNSGTEKYNETLAAMQESTGAASTAADVMGETTAHAGEVLAESFTNLKTVIGDEFTGALSGAENVLSGVLANITEAIQESPALQTAVTAIAAALSTVAVAITGISVALGVATAATKIFGAALKSALKPISIVVGALSAVVGIVTAVYTAIQKNKEVVEDYDGTLEECQAEIDATSAALADARERYGENSDAAKSLEAKLETLNKQYDKGGGYVQQLTDKVNEATESYQSLADAAREASTSADEMKTSGLSAVSMLASLAAKSETTNGDLDLMSSYASYLNDTFDCNIVVDYDTGDLTGFDPTTITQQILDAADAAKQQSAVDLLSDADFTKAYTEQYNNLTALYAERAELENEIRAQAAEDLNEYAYSTPEAYNEALDDLVALRLQQKKYAADYMTIADDIDAAESSLADMDNTIDENYQLLGMSADEADVYKESLRGLSDTTDEFVDSAENANEAIKGTGQQAQEIVEGVLNEYTDQILALADAYDEAYESAYESFSGQFGLFDEAQTSMDEYADYTLGKFQSAMETQTAYWENYAAAIESLSSYSAEELGLTEEQYDEFISYLSDGSEQAYALTQQLASAPEETVQETAQAYAQMQESMNQASQNAADWQTGFTETLGAILTEASGTMDDLLEEMEISDRVKSVAQSDMEAYAAQIKASGADAVNSAQSIANQIQQVFDNLNLTANIAVSTTGATDTAAHAKGTTNAEDVFIAGEEGAELIVGHAGSTVFPHDETEKIISAVDAYTGSSDSNYSEYAAPASDTSTGGGDIVNTVTLAPNFTLNLTGSTDSANKSQVTQWMQECVNDMFASVARTNPASYII